MIDLYTWPTPNGFKVSILLEELALPYQVQAVDIGKGEQFDPEFLRISPNNKVPALVDRDGPGGRPLALMESGAILIYLAEKAGKLMAADPAGRYDCLQWLMFQMASVGPMLGQNGHFRTYAPEPLPYAIDRYTNETRRLLGVMDRKLAKSEYLAGAYSIADIAVFPWLRNPTRHGYDRADYPHVERWFQAIDARPAVKAGLAVLADRMHAGPIDPARREVLFGATQYQRR